METMHIAEVTSKNSFIWFYPNTDDGSTSNEGSVVDNVQMPRVPKTSHMTHIHNATYNIFHTKNQPLQLDRRVDELYSK